MDHYTFTIVAKDGGNPPLSGTLTVHINVTDVNDNPPVFSEKVYDFTVSENAAGNQVLGQIRARDKDVGDNGVVRYKFSPHRSSRIEQLFYLDDSTGDIFVKSPLQDDAGSSYETIVEASDQGNPAQVSQAVLILRIQDVGNNPPRIQVSPVSSGIGDTVLLSEGARVGTVVAHIRITDKDRGQNGLVDCRTDRNQFTVESMEGGRGYIVQLKRPLDRETKDQHNVTIICEDYGNPRLSAKSTFTLRVIDENDNPPVFHQQVYVFNLTENNLIGDVIGRVSARDQDIGQNAIILYFLNLDSDAMFRIDHKYGDIIANGVFDRETLSQMTFTVKAVDEAEKPLTSSATVIINVLDKNDNKPRFVKSSLVLSVSEEKSPGNIVGKLEVNDADIGVNKEVEFTLMVGKHPDAPFAVFSNGLIKLNGKLDRKVKKRYEFDVIVKDKGRPPLNATGRVTVNVVDANDHSPVIKFPSKHNNTVVITSDTEPGTVVTRVIAVDEDVGPNGKIYYYIAGGNKDNTFHIRTKSGEIVLARQLKVTDPKSYLVTISVQDHGVPQQESQEKLRVNILLVNSTDSDGAGVNDFMYIIIAGVLGGVTIVISVIVVIVIFHIRRADSRRRNGNSIAIQEQGDGRTFEKQLWHSVPADDASTGSVDEHEKNIDDILKGKLGNKTSFSFDSGADLDDPYLKKLSSDQYDVQQFYTFRKTPSRVANDDFHSDSSGETTASDSGRGGSEEDIQLPSLAELKDHVTSFQNGLEKRSHKRIARPSAREQHNGLVTFETFVPRLHPTFSNQSPPASLTPSKQSRDKTGPYIAEKRRSRNLDAMSIGSFDDPLKAKRASIGKRVTFANEGLTQKNLKSLERFLHNGDDIPPINKVAFLCENPNGFRGNKDFSLPNTGSWYPSLPRSQDDDDNTTTSGSYTLNPEDIDDMFCESVS